MNTFTKTTRFVALLMVLAFSASISHAQDSPELTEMQLKEYAGTYGPRTIGISGKNLTFHRDGNTVATTLKHVEADEFEIVIPPGAVVQGHGDGPLPNLHFTRNDDGVVDGLKFIMPNGQVVAESKKAAAEKTDEIN